MEIITYLKQPEFRHLMGLIFLVILSVAGIAFLLTFIGKRPTVTVNSAKVMQEYRNKYGIPQLTPKETSLLMKDSKSKK